MLNGSAINVFLFNILGLLLTYQSFFPVSVDSSRRSRGLSASKDPANTTGSITLFREHHPRACSKIFKDPLMHHMRDCRWHLQHSESFIYCLAPSQRATVLMSPAFLQQFWELLFYSMGSMDSSSDTDHWDDLAYQQPRLQKEMLWMEGYAEPARVINLYTFQLIHQIFPSNVFISSRQPLVI